MRPADQPLARHISDRLSQFEHDVDLLPGIAVSQARSVFIDQLIESVRRIQYVRRIAERAPEYGCADPKKDAFNPLKAALAHLVEGDADEASWLVFLTTHFGRHPRAGWRYSRAVYRGVNAGHAWTWPEVSARPRDFRQWLHENQGALGAGPGPCGFGNHRKRESLNAWADRGTGAAVETYVRWVMSQHSHPVLFQTALIEGDGNPRLAFGQLYESMQEVATFGRTARFDYLAMIGKTGIANIEPDALYLGSATGPKEGARRLMPDISDSPQAMERNLKVLESYLELDFGMQALEDAVCNWNKSPMRFIAFRG